jgi:hypothetical protein
MPRFYSVAEANALLPDLIPRLETLRDLGEELLQVRTELDELRRHVLSNGHGAHAEALVERLRSIEGVIEEALRWLHAHDIELKDPRIGLIDFYHQRAGRTVYLCWKLGEPQVAYWHDLETGYAGRRPLDS